jgi:hypothetical protein
VVWTGLSPDEDGLLAFSAGMVTCPSGADDLCAEFRASVEKEGRQEIGLIPLPPEEVDESTSEPTDEPTDEPTGETDDEPEQDD